jgi:hypothetical protein
MPLRNSSEFLRSLRASIAKWKQEQLHDITQDYQDTTKLNQYIQLTGIAYTMLKEYLDTQGKHKVDSLLNSIIDAIGPLNELTMEEQMLVEDALTHDLLEYPFTYNTLLINSFDKQNVLNTNIIPNK